jgi:DNA-binding transcriptional regulator YiaG
MTMLSDATMLEDRTGYRTMAIVYDTTASPAPVGRSRWSVYSVFTALAFFSVGSGGTATIRASAVPQRSSPRVVVAWVSRARPADPAITTPERLKEIRRQLSLNVRQLARAMHVGRPAVYSWLDRRSTPRETQLQRLKQLYDAAEIWARMSDRPVGQNLRTPLEDGRSLASLLMEETLDVSAVTHALQTIRNAVLREGDRRAEYRSVADVARQRGFIQPSAVAARRRLVSESRRARWS